MVSNSQSKIAHGGSDLPGVIVENYNLEIRDEKGWYGDQASRRAFWALVDEWRKAVKKEGSDPFPETETEDISKSEFDQLLSHKDAQRASLAHSVIEDFSQNLVAVIERFLKVEKWKKVEVIVIGGGLQQSRAGQIVVNRAQLILMQKKIRVRLQCIENDPDHAGLVGVIHLIDPWMLQGYDGLLAVDIGGTNIRAGVLTGNYKKKSPTIDARVWKNEVWRHADDSPTRDATVAEIAEMLRRLIKRAESADLKIAPIIGIGCPGIIAADGSIKRGAQNLPGKWQSESFNLADAITKKVASIGGHEPLVIIHNDAVVQGLSELPRLKDIKHWAVLTIGTGLGNAKFTQPKPSLTNGNT